MRRTFWVAITCALAIGFAAAMSGCGSGPVNGNFADNTTSTASSFSRTTGRQRSVGTYRIVQ
jgi:F0F1-type ATP synthase membrane subunit c/vacuolar-type H+-ATPase subunit K